MMEEVFLDGGWPMDTSEKPAVSDVASGPVAALGTRVELDLVDEVGGVESLALAIVPDEEADFGRGLLGVGTPLARAIVGQGAGATVDYRMGDVVAVRIRRVAAEGRVKDPGAAAVCASIVRRAVARGDDQRPELCPGCWLQVGRL